MQPQEMLIRFIQLFHGMAAAEQERPASRGPLGSGDPLNSGVALLGGNQAIKTYDVLSAQQLSSVQAVGRRSRFVRSNRRSQTSVRGASTAQYKVTMMYWPSEIYALVGPLRTLSPTGRRPAEQVSLVKVAGAAGGLLKSVVILQLLPVTLAVHVQQQRRSTGHGNRQLTAVLYTVPATIS